MTRFRLLLSSLLVLLLLSSCGGKELFSSIGTVGDSPQSEESFGSPETGNPGPGGPFIPGNDPTDTEASGAGTSGAGTSGASFPPPFVPSDDGKSKIQYTIDLSKVPLRCGKTNPDGSFADDTEDVEPSDLEGSLSLVLPGNFHEEFNGFFSAHDDDTTIYACVLVKVESTYTLNLNACRYVNPRLGAAAPIGQPILEYGTTPDGIDYLIFHMSEEEQKEWVDGWEGAVAGIHYSRMVFRISPTYVLSFEIHVEGSDFEQYEAALSSLRQLSWAGERPARMPGQADKGPLLF